MTSNPDLASTWRDPRVKTQSIWLSSRGDFSDLKPADFGVAGFQGQYHPEIPYQMMRRYTQPGDVVFDPFAGCGTTADVGRLLGRTVISSDLTPRREDIIQADATVFRPDASVSLVMLHPPYWRMLQFSENPADLSNLPTPEAFVDAMEAVAAQAAYYLKPNGIAVSVISDVYIDGQQIPLGAMLYPAFRQRGFVLKGKIVKDFGETTGSAQTNARTKNLWRYRALRFGFWELGVDEIWVYQLRSSQSRSVAEV